MNKKEMDYCNYDKSQLGDGLKIAVLEYTTSKIINKIKNVIVPFPMMTTFLGKEEEDKNHAYKICSLISYYLPNSKIYLMSPNDKSLQFCIDNQIDIVNFSGSNCFASDSLEKELSKTALLLTSAGNEGDKGEKFTAMSEDWLAIGAVEFYKDKNKDKIKIADYSSYGNRKVISTGFSNLEFEENNKTKVKGTSFACPMVAILIGQYKMNYYKNHSVNLNTSYLKSVIMRDSKDILEYFKDAKSGYGIYTLTEV